VQGTIHDLTDFVCICPTCYAGDRCQFDLSSFSFSLDQLFHPYLLTSHKNQAAIALIVASLLYFLIALPNNIFAFVAVAQPSCRRSSIAQYLLCLSITNQLTLALLVARLIHIALKISGISTPMPIDLTLCRSLHYLLTSSGRLIYWLSACIAIERLYMTVVIRGNLLNNPRTARQLIALITVLILCTGAYEVPFIGFLPSLASGMASMCIGRFPVQSRSMWTFVHWSVSILHMGAPIVINLVCTISISIMIVKKKMKTVSPGQSECSSSHSVTLSSLTLDPLSGGCVGRVRFIVSILQQNKEFVIGPAITLVPQLFLIPQLIVSMLFSCQNLDASPLRYLLLVAMWTTYLPPAVSFWLYIAPSSFFVEQWRLTKISKWIQRTLQCRLR
jgi:hypothetical protein